MLLADSVTLTTNSVVAIPGMGKYEDHLVYCVNYSRAYYRHSNDSGKTFSAPVEITGTFEKFYQRYA